MEVNQVYQIANTLTQEYLGSTAVVQEDLSNIVDIGNQVINLDNLDKYVRSLIDQIGRIMFVDRPYYGGIPSLYMDAWEYGAILEKVTYDTVPEAEENETWELTNGQSYDPNVFTKPQVSAKFFSKKVTFDIPMSFAERQVKMAFQNATQLNSFFSMIQTAINNSMTVKTDSLAMRALNYMIALTINSGNASRAVNLLSLYNTTTGSTLTAAKALTTPEFIRFAAFTISMYEVRMGRLSTLFNDGAKDRFTPPDRMNVVFLADFYKAADAYLQSSTFHNEFTRLPKADLVPYWQGSGIAYDFNSVSKVSAQVTVNTTGTDGTTTQTTATVTQTGILGVMFDRFAVGISNLDRRVTANYNGRAEFFNNWYKFDCGYFDDPDENFVVFYIADSTTPAT